MQTICPAHHKAGTEKASKADAILDSMGKQRWKRRTDGEGLRNNCIQGMPSKKASVALLPCAVKDKAGSGGAGG